MTSLSGARLTGSNTNEHTHNTPTLDRDKQIYPTHGSCILFTESIQMPERSITSASTITQPNSYMYMRFNEQESIIRSERGASVGHDLTSLIDGYAAYTTASTVESSKPEEPIYEVKLSNSEEKQLFTRESEGSNYTVADDVLSGPRIVPGKENSDTEESPLPDEEYEYPYVDCKPPETGVQGCGLPSCPISGEDQATSSQNGHSGAFKRDSSVSSSEDYCQADAIPTVKITEVPIDGTYTALIRHPEPAYTTTMTFSSLEGSPVKDLSNIVGYVTSVSAVSFKHPPRPAVRRNTNEQTNQCRPPSASRLKLHQFRDVIEPKLILQTPESKHNSYVNDCVPSPVGKEKIKRPVPAPRARLLPVHFTENVEDLVL